MRPADVAQVIGRLKAAYPYVKTETTAAAVWAEQLDRVDVNVGVIAAKRWIERETFFPAVNEFLGTCQEVGREIARSAAELTPVEGDCGDERCPRIGFVFVSERGHGTVMPCQFCNAEGYRRWCGGHWELGHHCEECDELRSVSKRRGTR